MRNLKKILALALALVMTFSLMTVAGAKSVFSDADQIDATFEEAADVLSGLDLYKGRANNGTVTFDPEGTITRAEVAAVVYRIMTGDVSDKQASIYADYNKFKDVPSTAWYAGYVNFCANATLIKGANAEQTMFNPTGEINGYSVLALMLRAIGYGQNGEYEGEGWDLRTASMAQSLGILKNISMSTLRQPATREMVAELIFQAINVPTVDYTPSLGYNKYTSLNGTTLNQTLGEKQFGLVCKDGTYDVFGRPTRTWTASKGENKGTIAVIRQTPIKEYHEATTGATISSEAFNAQRTGLNVWINSVEWGGTRNQAYAFTADVAVPYPVGATGRTIEVYEDRMVIVDTMLAQVVAVTDVVNNAAGQITAQASLTLDVYAGANPAIPNADKGATVRVTLRQNSNYSYNVGDMLLVNPVIKQKANDSRNQLTNTGVFYSTDTVEVVGLAESFTGAMKIAWNATDRHTVDDTIYLDANCLNRDDAGTTPGTYRWYLDPWGNIIGITYVENSRTYGIIEAIQWRNDLLVNGYAVANLRLMDGSLMENVRIANIGDLVRSYGSNNVDGKPAEPTALDYAGDNISVATRVPSLADGYVSTTVTNNNAQFRATAMYQIVEGANGAYTLRAVANSLDTNANPLYWNSKGATTNVKGGRAVETAAGAMDVSVKAGMPYLVGTAHAQSYWKNPTDNKITVGVDNTTQYLFVNTANNAVTAVTGFMGIGEWVADWVDYVDDDNDNRAEYVVVHGKPKAATTTKLFYFDTDISASSNNGSNITVYGLVDGEQGSITFANNVYRYLTDTNAADAVQPINISNGAGADITRGGNEGAPMSAQAVLDWMYDIAGKDGSSITSGRNDKYNAILFEVALEGDKVVAIRQLDEYFNDPIMKTVVHGNPIMTGSYKLGEANDSNNTTYSIRFDAYKDLVNGINYTVYYRGDVVSFDRDGSTLNHSGDDIWFNVDNTTVFNIAGKTYTQATLNAGTEFEGSVYVVYDARTWVAKTVYVTEAPDVWQPASQNRVYAIEVDGRAVASASLGGYRTAEEAVANAVPYPVNVMSSGSSHSLAVWWDDGIQNVYALKAGSAADAVYYANADMLTRWTLSVSGHPYGLYGSLYNDEYLVIRTDEGGPNPVYTYYAVRFVVNGWW